MLKKIARCLYYALQYLYNEILGFDANRKSIFEEQKEE